MQLHEQYRPRTWNEVVAQDKVLAKIEQLRGRGLAGRAYFLSGPSGAGKTTIARLIAAEVADDFNVEEIDASDFTPAALQRVERGLQTRGLGERSGRAVILNEVHGLRRDTVRQLLVTLERLPSHVVFIFTTTCEGQDSLFEECEDSHPLLSRCIVLPLARRDLAKPFAERARMIAVAEGLNGRPIADYVRLCKTHRNNLRAMLQSIEAGSMALDV